MERLDQRCQKSDQIILKREILTESFTVTLSRTSKESAALKNSLALSWAAQAATNHEPRPTSSAKKTVQACITTAANERDFLCRACQVARGCDLYFCDRPLFNISTLHLLHSNPPGHSSFIHDHTLWPSRSSCYTVNSPNESPHFTLVVLLP